MTGMLVPQSNTSTFAQFTSTQTSSLDLSVSETSLHQSYYQPSTLRKSLFFITMSSNDGQKLLVFGLSFAQHDNRKMQQILRHYNKLPASPGSRANVFLELNKLARELAADGDAQDQVQRLTSWLQQGGDFPLATAPDPINGSDEYGLHMLDRRRRENVFSAISRARGDESHGLYGRGRTLGEAEHADDLRTVDSEADADMSETVSNDDSEMYGTHPSQMARLAPENASSTPWDAETDSEEDEENSDDDMGGVLERDHFAGRGRTLNDFEHTQQPSDERSVATHFDAQMPSTGISTTPPQLLHNNAWRGNNIVGFDSILQGHLLGDDGMPLMDPTNADDGDLDEDERNTRNFGPGRTLNDPIPAWVTNDDHPNPTQHPDHIMRSVSSERDDAQSEEDERESSPAPDVDMRMSNSELDEGAEEVECPICFCQYPVSGFPARATVTELCDHPDKACVQCIAASISETVKRGALHLLACPICPQKLTRNDIKEYSSKDVYERYTYLKQQSEIPGHWISCTNPSCGGSQPHDSKSPDGPKMICNHCQHETCARHRRPWHEGQSCMEFDMDPAQIERLEEEEATARLLSQEDTSICPKCGQGVTKTEGCDHMACQCGTEWCYVVSRPVDSPESVVMTLS